MVWIDDPKNEDDGDVWTRPYQPDTAMARRGIGRYSIVRAWSARTGGGRIPMVTVNVTFDDGQKGWGHMRGDQPGYLHVFERAR